MLACNKMRTHPRCGGVGNSRRSRRFRSPTHTTASSSSPPRRPSVIVFMAQHSMREIHAVGYRDRSLLVRPGASDSEGKSSPPRPPAMRHGRSSSLSRACEPTIAGLPSSCSRPSTREPSGDKSRMATGPGSASSASPRRSIPESPGRRPSRPPLPAHAGRDIPTRPEMPGTIHGSALIHVLMILDY
jgi:hypothetical protein